jgi:3'(2'), 5'-bisphosphate nucleotidase
MNSKSLPPMTDLVAVAREAGDAILEIYNRDFAVYEKKDKSPLTDADLAAHKVITGRLAELTPEIPVLSEESAQIPYEERASWTTYWLVDPLDGTKEFIKRNGEFTVNIALVEEQRASLGIVHVPVSGVTYYGLVGEGAFVQDGDDPPSPIQATGSVPARPRVVGSRSHAGESLRRYLENLGDHELVPMGSSLKLCLVAEGKADIYPRLGPTSEWDTAAAQAVVEAAGGRVTDTEMRHLRYNTKESLLNPEFLVFGDTSEDWSRFLAT